MDENELLVREKAAPLNITPTGRKLGVIPVKGSNMYRVAFVDGKAGDLPDAYAGKYTALHYATAAMKDYVSKFWDQSEASQSNKKKPLSLNAVSR
jgi:hypothetical protein